MDELFEIRSGQSDVLAAERERILHLLLHTLPRADISEVGSTAIEGAIGKQDVDIAVLVDAIEFDGARAALDRIFLRDPNQLSSACYQAYRTSASWDVAVQLTVKGGPYDNFHEFLTALKTSPELLQAYNQLKRTWHGKSMNDYRQAKSEFISHVLKLK